MFSPWPLDGTSCRPLQRTVQPLSSIKSSQLSSQGGPSQVSSNAQRKRVSWVWERQGAWILIFKEPRTPQILLRDVSISPNLSYNTSLLEDVSFYRSIHETRRTFLVRSRICLAGRPTGNLSPRNFAKPANVGLRTTRRWVSHVSPSFPSVHGTRPTPHLNLLLSFWHMTEHRLPRERQEPPSQCSATHQRRENNSNSYRFKILVVIDSRKLLKAGVKGWIFLFSIKTCNNKQWKTQASYWMTSIL